MKVLNIVESAWRCTVEEQDDPAVWICHAMRDAGAELSVLLVGNAAAYAAAGHDASGLTLGDWVQTQPPAVDRELASLVEKGVPVYAVLEDARERGVAAGRFVPGVLAIERAALPGLLAEHGGVWHW